MNPMSITIPRWIESALDRLERAGFSAFAVGGCVRDSLLGREPADWDVATSALPDETMRCFAELRPIPTGLKHGTVTVLIDGNAVEITTFRTDGAYSDARRPDSVTFIRDLRDDLARRDFTVNAMALGKDGQIRDPFGGRADIAGKTLRCVGEPRVRFSEDALRILRLFRFAAELGFSIHPETLSAAQDCRQMLRKIAAERIGAELIRLVSAPNAADSVRLMAQAGVLDEILPGVTVGDEELRLLRILPAEPELRLCALFYGGSAPGAKTALHSLRQPNSLADGVYGTLAIIRTPVPSTQVQMRRLLHRAGLDSTRRFLLLRNPPDGGEPLKMLGKIEEERQCWSLDRLAVAGRDLMEEGIMAGRTLGDCLYFLLDLVIADHTQNTRENLLRRAKMWYDEYRQKERVENG